MAKILVIDDDISLLQLIKNALEYDHSITTYTGLSSVSIREINKHDLLILDVMMPELDGFTFLKEKRREIDIPVLFLTALTYNPIFSNLFTACLKLRFHKSNNLPSINQYLSQGW